MTDDPLHLAAKRYRVSLKALTEDRNRLYSLIRKARGSGRTLREIADVVGLSHGRVQQIMEEKKR